MSYFDFSLRECTEADMKFNASVVTALALWIVLDALSARSTALRPPSPRLCGSQSMPLQSCRVCVTPTWYFKLFSTFF
jgi:hypothetical protein